MKMHRRNSENTAFFIGATNWKIRFSLVIFSAWVALSTKIVYAGSEVQKNLRDLGHITLRFNNNDEGEGLEGSLYLEDKPIVDVVPGDEISIVRP